VNLMNPFPALNNFTIDILKDGLFEIEFIFPDKDDPINLSELPEKIRSFISDESIIFINLNFKSDTQSKYQSLNGAEFLIWLRLEGINNHCVLYSFESLHQILKRFPSYSILTSQGTTFIRLPDDFALLNINQLSQEKAEVGNLKKCLTPLFNIEKIRHRLANIYGLFFLSIFHETYFDNTFDRTHINSPIDFLQIKLSTFLLQGSSSEFKVGNLKTEISDYRTQVHVKKPTILCIDDQGEEGWFYLLKHILYSNPETAPFRTLNPSKSDFLTIVTTDAFYRKVQEHVKGVDCVLLDLRLAGEEEVNDNFESLSGAILLKRLHRDYPYLPIICTTASNKAYTVNKILSLGAFSLWSKPGIDQSQTEEAYLESYRDLVKQVFLAITKYKTKAEKLIVETQYKLHQRVNESIPEYSVPEFFHNYDYFIPDTNIFLLESAEFTNMFLNLKSLSELKNREGDPKLVIIDDVRQELYRLSLMGSSRLTITQNTNLINFIRMNRSLITSSWIESEEVVNDFFTEFQNLFPDPDVTVSVFSNCLNRYINQYNETKTKATFAIHFLNQLYSQKKSRTLFNEVEKSLHSNPPSFEIVGDPSDGFYLQGTTQRTIAFNRNREELQSIIDAREPHISSLLHADSTFTFLLTHLFNTNQKAVFISNDIQLKRSIIAMIYAKAGLPIPVLSTTSVATKLITIQTMSQDSSITLVSSKNFQDLFNNISPNNPIILEI